MALLVERKHDGVGRRIDIEPDHVAELVDELGIARELELAEPMGLEAMGPPDAPDRDALMPLARAIRSAIQCVVSPGGWQSSA